MHLSSQLIGVEWEGAWAWAVLFLHVKKEQEQEVGGATSRRNLIDIPTEWTSTPPLPKLRHNSNGQLAQETSVIVVDV